MRGVARTMLVGLAALCVGCPASSSSRSEGSDPGTERVPGRTHFRHDGYAFELRAPGDGWRVLDALEIRALRPDAAAGLNSPRGDYCMVFVERWPDAEFAEYEAVLDEEFAGMQLLERTEIQVSGYPAVRRTFTYEQVSVPMRAQQLLVVRDGWVYQVMASAVAERADDSRLRQAIDAFALVDAPVRGTEVPYEAVGLREGATWRIEQGVFRSALGGPALSPTLGWRFLSGWESLDSQPEANIVLEHTDSGAYLAIEVTPLAGRRPEVVLGRLKGDLEDVFGASSEGPVRKIQGHEVPFSIYKSGKSTLYEAGLWVDEEADAVVELDLWYSPSLTEPARSALDELLAGLGEVTAQQRTELRERLARVHRPQSWIGATGALRGGIYVDFLSGLVWTRPDPLTRVWTGESAEYLFPESLFAYEVPDAGLLGIVEVFSEDEVTPAGYHQNLSDGLHSVVTESRTIGGRAWTVTTGRSPDGTSPERVIVATTTRQGVVFAQTLLGPSASPEHDASVERALDSLRIREPLAQTSEQDSEFTDHRFGLAFRPPGDGWIRTERELAVGDFGRQTAWKRGNQAISLLTIQAPRVASLPDWTAEQLASRLVGADSGTDGRAPSPRVRPAKLGGFPSHAIDAGSTRYDVTVRQEVLVMLMTFGLSDEEARAASAGFRWCATIELGENP